MTDSALTDRQSEVLEFISQFVQSHGYPPTRTEISRGFGWSSANAAEEHITALARKGRLIVHRNIARGLVLL
jgi:repressor LexA